jgi:NADP-dependent 3-hydroxy acid dehydrogenase YdfG
MAAPLVIITGASQGIGRASALAFARAGHSLLLLARHAAALGELAGAPHRFIEVDVADFASFAAAVAEAEAAFGPADCLVNNAGFLRVGDLGSRSPDDLDRDVDVLFNGVLHGIRAVLPGMTARRRGTIINVSSVVRSQAGTACRDLPRLQGSGALAVGVAPTGGGEEQRAYHQHRAGLREDQHPR